MALVRIDHVPETVKVNLPLNVILPDPGRMQGVPVRDRKVLYLLHGLSDDASAWQRYSSIETVASAYGLVVVMPSVGRSFYLDQPNGQAYFTYLVDELPRYLSDVFDLAPRRENTLIAGLSMGGYGTLKAALLHPELYSAAAMFFGRPLAGDHERQHRRPAPGGVRSPLRRPVEAEGQRARPRRLAAAGFPEIRPRCPACSSPAGGRTTCIR